MQPGSHGACNIKINFLSTSSDQQRVSLVRRLAANDSSIDILAMDVDQCLIQDKNQSRDAIKGGLAPVAASIYDQPAFDKAYPFHQLIKQQLQTYGIRPQTPAYADVTLAIQKTLSPSSNINPNTVVSTLRNEIKLSLSSSALM